MKIIKRKIRIKKSYDLNPKIQYIDCEVFLCRKTHKRIKNYISSLILSSAIMKIYRFQSSYTNSQHTFCKQIIVNPPASACITHQVQPYPNLLTRHGQQGCF